MERQASGRSRRRGGPCVDGAVWAAEVDKWESLLPNVDAFDVVSKMDAQTVQRSVRNWKRRGGLFIIGHDHFARMMDELELDDGCIFAVDEAHILKTPTTQLYHAFSKVTTNKRVFLTGTPLQNHLKEYYAMVQLLSPGLLGDTLTTFRKTYGRAIEDGMLKDSTDEQISNCEKAVQVLWRMADVMHEKSPELLREHIPSKHEFRISTRSRRTAIRSWSTTTCRRRRARTSSSLLFP